MKGLDIVIQIWSCWIGAVANFLVGLEERFVARKVVSFDENERGDLVLQKGQMGSGQNAPDLTIPVTDEKINVSAIPDLAIRLQHRRIELTLRSERFIFVPIELPSRAADFLDGLVRAQIDRLTPWSSSEAAFGWSKPVKKDDHRIVVNLAATAQSLVKPYVEAMASAGAHSISIYTSPSTAVDGDRPIKVWEETARGALGFTRIRQILSGTMALAVVIAGISIGAAAIVGPQYDAQRDDLEMRISSFRAAANPTSHSTLTPSASDLQSLARRKNETFPVVAVLEALSRILPEHTYVTEFRIDGSKLRVVGVTRDAPSLVALMEQSQFFSRASFFAPTTRASSQAGELFHIETTIEPLGSARS